jgi:predicted aldo/keto reductase-like oxidoreductase
MQYSVLGRTGYKVSRLGFGAMRLPMAEDKIDRDLAIPMLHHAFDEGVNFVDTAVGYCNADSQVVVGEAVKSYGRDKLVLSTKNHYYGENEKEWWQNLEDSLERLQVQTIDVYNTHGINLKNFENAFKPRIIHWMNKAKDQGLIKNICTSFHDKPEVLHKIVDSGCFGSVLLQYNMLDRQLEDEIAFAKENGMGVIVMGPVGGGSLGGASEVLKEIIPEISRVPELALRFVLANPNVDIVLSGMSTMEQVKENVKIVSDAEPLSDDEVKIINDQLERLGSTKWINCTNCGYCQPCKQEVKPQEMFGLYNKAQAYGLWDHSKKGYQGRKVKGDACIRCGECEPKCPQKIPICDMLDKIHEELSQ